MALRIAAGAGGRVQEAGIDQGFVASAIHTPALGAVEALDDRLITLDAAGRIEAILPAASEDATQRIGALRGRGRLTELAPGQYLLPGLIDLHVHAPQWPQLGRHLDQPLEVWLQQHTFPLEARYADEDFAHEVYDELVATLLANGTTTAVYFATIHLAASAILARICLARGQRALVGRVAMDEPTQCPPWYRDASAAAGIADTRRFIDLVQALPGNAARLVQPAITPRFAPACSPALLRGLGELAAETGRHVQTHVSESDWEHAYVRDRYGVSDARWLDAAGLLGRRTILAHGVFLDDADLDLIGLRRAGLAHCPLSNVYFAGAVLPARRISQRGIAIGLGTDISGGASASLFAAARQAMASARMLERGVDPATAASERGRPDARISALEAFWLATAGGAQVLDMAIGQFRPGYAFDAMMIDLGRREGDLRGAAQDAPAALVEKLVHGASRADVRRVWVAGRLVHRPPDRRCP